MADEFIEQLHGDRCERVPDSATVGAGDEQFVGDDLAAAVVIALHVTHLRDDTAAVRCLGDEHDEIQSKRGELQDVASRPVASARPCVHREAGEDRERRIGMDRAHRPRDALGHCFQHVDHFRAAYLTDDDSPGDEPLDRSGQIGQHDRAGALGVRLAFHQREDVVVTARVPIEMQLGFLFEHDDPLVGVELVSERSQQRGLPGALPAGDQHVLA